MCSLFTKILMILSYYLVPDYPLTTPLLLSFSFWRIWGGGCQDVRFYVLPFLVHNYQPSAYLEPTMSFVQPEPKSLKIDFFCVFQVFPHPCFSLYGIIFLSMFETCISSIFYAYGRYYKGSMSGKINQHYF